MACRLVSPLQSLALDFVTTLSVRHSVIDKSYVYSLDDIYTLMGGLYGPYKVLESPGRAYIVRWLSSDKLKKPNGL